MRDSWWLMHDGCVQFTERECAVHGSLSGSFGESAALGALLHR
jgi:hypothetical protein